MDLIDEMGYQRVGSVASGNRAMMLLEGKGGAYIRDTGGFAKWDTSAPTAVLEAYGSDSGSQKDGRVGPRLDRYVTAASRAPGSPFG